MADHDVPPRRPTGDDRWDGRYPTARTGRRDPVHQHRPDPYGEPQSYARPATDGPRWIGPADPIPQVAARRAAVGLPDLDDDEDDRRLGRRRALTAIGGTAAVVAGGAALAMSPAGQNLIDRIFGTGADEAAAAVTDGTAARPSGVQPASVRTYTEQNESYMGSRAGEALKRNAPAGGRLYDGPAAAAAATKPSARTVLAHDPVRHLASRLTFGATPTLLAQIRQVGIDAWIRSQLEPEKIAPTRAELKLAELTTLKMSIPQLREAQKTLQDKGIAADRETINATIARQIWSERQLFEVMVDFWNDFLHVGPFFDRSQVQRASFDRDVIRKHALGSYVDMFVAANRHPALLTYLNQNQSSKDEVNENLARENLELYSVGVDGGYTEKDVRQAALLQTGRGVANDEYVYRPERHHVGPVKILGFTHANASAAGGEAAADAYFRYLALHPSTARYVATNLATRFVSDTPPKALVERLAKSYTTSKGQIKPVLVTLLRSSEFWASVGQKVRRPMEYLVATYRVLGVSPEPSPGYRSGSGRTPFAEGLDQIRNKMEELGQFPTGMPTPNGYPDVFVAWTSAGTMINGWNEAGALVAGSRRQFSYAKPERLVSKPPATAGAYVDALAVRLVHQKLTAKEKALILGIAGVPAGATVDATFNGAVTAIARALLASPQHHLR
ncbi:DUF1800 domain-containing protein [Micromonospora zhanjiangensis]|uniref:DUF1800 domain-containing protein n=1 Tax=Micromonospora zhanjiangensis TaxID=1522057 RepID=A0ABV8KHS2_9ACTN